MLRTGLGWLLALIVRLWAATWRVRVVHEAGAEAAPRVLAFWHGQQMPLIAARARPSATLVSWSKDGQLQSAVMRGLGLRVVRGSSSRGGAAGLRAIVRALRSGLDAAFAVDGPRGPLGRAKPGAAEAGRLARTPVVPVGSAASRVLVLERSWDRFAIPWPFCRVVVVAGSPIDPEAALRTPQLLELGIQRAERRAHELLAASSSRSVQDHRDRLAA